MSFESDLRQQRGRAEALAEAEYDAADEQTTVFCSREEYVETYCRDLQLADDQIAARVYDHRCEQRQKQEAAEAVDRREQLIARATSDYYMAGGAAALFDTSLEDFIASRLKDEGLD